MATIVVYKMTTRYMISPYPIVKRFEGCCLQLDIQELTFNRNSEHKVEEEFRDLYVKLGDVIIGYCPFCGEQIIIEMEEEKE